MRDNQDDGPGEEVGMLPFRGDDPSSTGVQKRRSGGSAGTIGMANGSGAGGAAGSEVCFLFYYSLLILQSITS